MKPAADENLGAEPSRISRGLGIRTRQQLTAFFFSDAARRSPRIAKAKPVAAAVPGYMKPTALSQVRQGSVVGFNFTAPAKVSSARILALARLFYRPDAIWGVVTGCGCKRPRILEECKHAAHDALS